jgi:hypothetical protein
VGGTPERRSGEGRKLARREYRAIGHFLSRVFLNYFCICSFFRRVSTKNFRCTFGQFPSIFSLFHNLLCASLRIINPFVLPLQVVQSLLTVRLFSSANLHPNRLQAL